jgi:hypothetical protein
VGTYVVVRGIDSNQPGPSGYKGSAANLLCCVSTKLLFEISRTDDEASAGSDVPSKSLRRRCAGVGCCPTSQLTVVAGEPHVMLASVFACGSGVGGCHVPGK